MRREISAKFRIHTALFFLTLLGTVAAQDLPINGTFVGGDDAHEAAGSFEIAATEEGRVLNFSEDFSVRRGPDLFVWLVQGDDVENRATLERLQSARGAQSYVIPNEVDLSSYDRVLVWCRAFGVLFATGEFGAAGQASP